MRILIVSPYFCPEGGGLERYACEMARELARNYEVTVICATKGRPRDERWGRITVIRRRPHVRVSNTPVRFTLPFELVGILKRGGFAGIIAHTPVPFYADVASLVARLMRKEITVMYHSGELRKGSWVDALAVLYERTVEKATLRGVKLLAVSRHVQRVLREKGFRSRVKYPRLDERFRSVRPNFKGDYILFVGQLGRFHRWKNLELLLRAVAMVRRELPNVRLLVVGDGDMRDYYEDLARRLGLEENVQFLGFVSDEELIELYRNAKLLVLPSSKSEAFGMVVVEAMSLGTPVVVSRVGEFPVIVPERKGGLLVELEADKLAKAILTLLLDEKKRRKMAVIAWRSVRRFTS